MRKLSVGVTEIFEAVPAMYIADGHHRSALQRWCAEKAKNNPTT
jgi:uncharacterized protein (DUF1015 family)